MSFWEKLFGSKRDQSVPPPLRKPYADPPLPEIHAAARDGDLERVKRLLQHDPQLISSKDKSNYTPIVWAALKDRRDIVAYFLANGVKAERVHISYAASKEIVEILMRDRDINENIGGWTLLHSAASNLEGYEPLAEFLMERNPAVNITNTAGRSPLHFAAHSNHLKLARWLLDKGADASAVDHQGQTPLHHAVTHKGNSEMLEMLLAKQADINARDNTGRTALHLAAFDGKTDLVKTLLAHKADPNIKDRRGKTPTELAIIAGEEEIERMLRANGGLPSEPPAWVEAVTLPADLMAAARKLEQRFNELQLDTRKVPFEEWHTVPRQIHDIIPPWLPSLLAEFSLVGGALKCEHESSEWPLHFYFLGPDMFAHYHFGKGQYCFADEFIEEGFVILTEEHNSNMWLTSISEGPASPIYLFDISAHERTPISKTVALFLENEAVDPDEI